MSSDAVGHIWKWAQCRGTRLLVLLALGDFADETGLAWPSVASLAKKCRLSQRQTQNILRDLRTSGEVRVESGGGRSQSNVYRINVQSLGAVGTKPSPESTAVEEPQAAGAETLKSATETMKSATETTKLASPNPPGTVRTVRTTSSSEVHGASDKAKALAELLRGKILENNPKAKITEAQVLNWAREADRMMRFDHRTEAEIREMIEWSQRDAFWRANILSMGKLREKFDQLTLKAKGGRNATTERPDGGGSPGGVGPRSRVSTGSSTCGDLSRFEHVGRRAGEPVA